MQGPVSYSDRESLPGLISALFNTSADGWFIVEPGSKQVTYANKAALQLFETDTFDELANLVQAGVPGENAEPFPGGLLDRVITSMNRQGHYDNEAQYLGKTGRRIWARSGATVFEHNGNRYVLIQIVDTTCCRGRREHTELEEALAVQKLVFENSGAMMMLAGADYVIRQVNPTLEKKMGYCAEDLVGKKKIAFLLGSGSYPPQIAAGSALREAFIQETIGEGPLQDEFTFKRKNGDELPVSVTVSLLRNVGGALIGFLVLAFDMSLHKAIEEELQRSLQQERRLSELKSRFVSLASHEFRTPLSTILSSVYLMQHYTRTEEQPLREKHIRRIESSVSLLNDILDDFLSVEKIEEGKVCAKCSEFAVSELVQSVLEEMRPILKTGQYFSYRHSGGATILLDPLLLRHILLNLLSNAIKFSGEHQEILIITTTSANTFSLVIKDRGIGISAEDCCHLFQRFFRASNAAHIKGTGLGLHIVKKYAELMKGNISIKSEPDSGTEVLVCFNG